MPPNSRAPSVTHAVVFISRPSIRPVLRQELKNAGIRELINVDTVEACTEKLIAHPRALLVLDWEHGQKTVNAILRRAQGHFNVDTRPIFMIAADVSSRVVAVGAEYYIARIHTGEISRSVIQEHLEMIIEDEDDNLGVRPELTKVADLRMRGDWGGAGRLLADLERRHPGNHRIICEHVSNLIHEDRWSEAKAALEAAAPALIGAEHDLRLMQLKARCLMKERRFDEAATLLTHGKILNPFNIDRLVDLGQALMEIDRLKEALATFDEALELQPGHRAAMQGKAQATMLEGDANAALTLLKQMSGPREIASVFNNAAILAVHQARFDLGFDLYRTALSSVGAKDRVAARLLFNLGIAFFKQGRLEEALKAFEQAWQCDRLFTNAQSNAAAVAQRIGRRVDSGPESPRAGDAEGAKPSAPDAPKTPSKEVDEQFADVFDEERVNDR